jgi:hypothetical protein
MATFAEAGVAGSRRVIHDLRLALAFLTGSPRTTRRARSTRPA